METLDYERDNLTDSGEDESENSQDQEVDYNEEDNSDNNEKKGKEGITKSHKKKKKHPKKIELTDYDKLRLNSSNEDLMKLIKRELEEKKEECVRKLKKLNKQMKPKEKAKNVSKEDSSKESKEDVNLDEVTKQKKYLQAKIRKYKKTLTNEVELKSRLNLLKVRIRKTKTICKKLETKEKEYMKKKVRCFNCRRRGHLLSECREAKVDKGYENKENNDYIDSNDKIKKNVVKSMPVVVNKHICYNCGKTDHILAGCDLKVENDYLKFAECFICKKKGHISAKCPLSDKGIYPHGGNCFVCGEKDHLAKNCPQKQIEIQKHKEEREKEKLDKAKLLKKKRDREVYEKNYQKHLAKVNSKGSKQDKESNEEFEGDVEEDENKEQIDNIKKLKKKVKKTKNE